MSLRRLRVFISSPGDLRPEREAAERVVRTIAKHPLYRPHFAIEADLYEDAVPAAIGLPSQASVDDYLIHPSEADLFVCMLWQRFGTPFSYQGRSYSSGTEYEFDHAYQALQSTGKPAMLLYQCQRPLAHDCDLLQAGMVRDFFLKLRQGVEYQGLYKSFTTQEQFESTLAADLHQVIGKLLGAAPPAAAPAPALTISSLNDPYRLLPLDGHPVLTSPTGEKVFTGGARLSFTLTNSTPTPAALHAITLNVVTHKPEGDPHYQHALAGPGIIGAGIAKAHEFAIALRNGAPTRARWITAPGQFALAQSDNFLDTPQPFVITLAPNEIEQINGTILVQETAYYELTLTFHTSTGAHTSEPIRLYAETK